MARVVVKQLLSQSIAIVKTRQTTKEFLFILFHVFYYVLNRRFIFSHQTKMIIGCIFTVLVYVYDLKIKLRRLVMHMII